MKEKLWAQELVALESLMTEKVQNHYRAVVTDRLVARLAVEAYREGIRVMSFSPVIEKNQRESPYATVFQMTVEPVENVKPRSEVK